MDFIKLDDPSVSNDTEYTYNERNYYSTAELERYMLHKNFRVHLVRLEPEWCDVTFLDTHTTKRMRSVERNYQGV